MSHEEAHEVESIINGQPGWTARVFELGDSMFRGIGWSVHADHTSGKDVWIDRKIDHGKIPEILTATLQK